MADIFRYRYGETNPVMVAVDAATAIEVGDMVYLDTDDAKPIASHAQGASEAADQAAVHDKFLGIAEQRHRATTDPAGEIRVATTGVFELDTASASYEIGALVGIERSGGAFYNQRVKAADSGAAANAVGRVEKKTASATKVLVSIKGSINRDGVQAIL